MNKSNDIQMKTVFSAAKYLSVMMKICNDTHIESVIIPAINPKGWVWACDGKTIEECRDLHFDGVEEWCIEIPQNENIDFWRNYSN